ncbi:MAG TPA: aldehyde dehydrogenase family protein [Polyangiaceae bacterium]|nr:aldehyde dehydrogenase family protein [Polyangiaceae bacterium]
MALTITNPATEEVIRELPEDDAGSVADKLARARAAQPAWAARPMAERLGALRTFGELVAARTDELARTTTDEVGKPVTQAKNELKGLLARLEFFLEATPSALADEVVFSEGVLEERIAHEPLGVVVNVSAWNYPYFVGSNVFVPALLAGNAVLYKPSEHATLTGLAVARLLHEAGVPEDLFAPVVGGGPVGAELVRQPVGGVFFTGSYATGKKIAAAAAPNMVKLQLELGGKDPVYVTDDVDVRAAAEATADGAFYNAGQSCCAVERVYVHERVHDEYVKAFVETVKGFAVGDPRDEATYLGPLARKEQLAVLEDQVAEAKQKGGRVELGGARMARKGYYFEPTVVTGATHAMRLMRDESFGPVIGIQAVKGDDEALALMNDTPYGLTAGVYTHDRARAERLLRGVSAGSAYWNCCDRVSPRLPWSGRGHSGVGATLSRYGILAFTQPKAWHLRRA